VRELPLTRDEAALVQGREEGESWARVVLFQRHGRDAQRVLARILGHDPDLEDLVQEVFLRALDGIGRLEQADKLRSWVVAIAVFTARERIRAQRRGWWMILSPSSEVEGLPMPSEPDDELSEATYRVLHRMPGDERVALALRMIEGMELSEVADA
jgi:RNA polymerase sigma-70 factor (ECF subfamily)